MPILTIDGVQVSIQEGATVLEAASEAGIWIPTLCWYPKISPSDSCRMCVVEIDGTERPMTSCNSLALDGMVVLTDTPRLRTMREQVMKLVLVDHPLECPICPAGGECDIQDLTHRLGIQENEFQIPKRTEPVVQNWPLIEYNINLCITCTRCVKVCHEVIGASALSLKQVGYQAGIGTNDDGVLDCDFCGECVEACPSGAMTYKLTKDWARSWELRKTPTVCPLCSAGCRLEMNVKDDKIFRVTTNIETHNQGTLCVGGRFGQDLIQHEERLVSPLLRQDGRLVPASWEDAIEYVSGALERIVKESGPDSVAGLASPRLMNEDNYAFQKFFRGTIGTNNVDSEARFSFLRVQRAFELTCGTAGGIGTIEELLDTDAILLIGTDPIEETPALGWKIKAATRRYDSNLVVANSRETSVDRYAKVRLRTRPYSETDLVLGLMKVILDRDLWDEKFVGEQTTHFLPMKNLLDKISLKGILKRTGVSQEDLEEAALLFARAPRASIIFGGDVILQENGLQCVMNVANLALLTGNMGKSNRGLYPIFEKGNIQGICDMGVFPEYLPGYQDLATARDLFENVWKTDLPYTRGRTASEMALGLETGDVRALYVAGADPLTGYPNAGRFSSALEKAELLVVQDLFLSPTAQKAHCVFPASSFAEREGTMTNIEHRIQKLRPVISPRGQSRPDWNILEEVATAMGKPMGFFSVADIFREMSLTIPFYRGLQFDKLNEDGTIARPKYSELESTRSGRPYSFAPVRIQEAPEGNLAAEYPFEMMAGRSMYHFGSFSTRSRNLLSLCPQGYVELNVEDAHELSIADGDPVRVASPIADFTAPAKLSGKVGRKMIFVPTNFPELGVYRLFEENTNVCRVKVSLSK
jgi:formate dehydrogenase (NADP+) alpha subunit